MNGRFYEWTNSVFNTLVDGKNFYKKNDGMQLALSGYEALAPLGSMLASALGVSEIEFVKIKDKGKEYGTSTLKEMFKDSDNASEVLNKVKEIFDEYELDADHALNKKQINQNLLNEMYAECLEIMKKRIKMELQCDNITDIEEYKKHQMFFLKKMNFNYKNASKKDGLRFSKTSMVHDIGFCTDKLPKKDFIKIGKEYTEMADYGFDNADLEKYNRALTKKYNDKNSFLKFIKVPHVKFSKAKEVPEITNDTTEKSNEIDDDKLL